MNKDETADVALPGDAALVIEALIEELRERLGEDVREEGVAAGIAADRDAWLAEWSPLLESDVVPINTYRVIREIDRVLDRERSIVTHDAGAPRDSIVPFFTATTPHSYVGWGKTTHLGFSIPLMIGAKLAHPDRFCLNLMGDGAFGMSGMDIETSARAGVPITTVVLNNGGMATYPGGFPTAREQYGVSHMTGNYAQIAEGMGAVGIEVHRTWRARARARTGAAAQRRGPYGAHRRALEYGGASLALRSLIAGRRGPRASTDTGREHDASEHGEARVARR